MIITLSAIAVDWNWLCVVECNIEWQTESKIMIGRNEKNIETLFPALLHVVRGLPMQTQSRHESILMTSDNYRASFPQPLHCYAARLMMTLFSVGLRLWPSYGHCQVRLTGERTPSLWDNDKSDRQRAFCARTIIRTMKWTFIYYTNMSK